MENKFYNPFDISKDGQSNNFIEGIRIHIRNSDELKEKIKNMITKDIHLYKDFSSFNTNLQILEYYMNKLNIYDDDLTIADEHELLDWINCNFTFD